MTSDDMDLVREYAASQSDSAFASIVSRHVNLVYSAALRQVRDPHLAQEVTQTAFIVLARKAGSLPPGTILSGWLYRTARFVSATALKRETRRHRREQEAHMQSTLDESAADSTWEQLAPVLDEAMTQLRAKDRDAVVLRYFENKSLREVGVALGVEERAAQKRVARGLEKLRSLFARRGFVLTPAIIAGAVSANAVQAAPAGLAASTLANAGTATTFALMKATLEAMFYAKLQAAGFATSILVAVVAGILFAQRDWKKVPERVQIGGINKSPAAADAQRYVEIRAEMETLSYRLGDDLREGKNPVSDSYSLVCTVGTNEWRIDRSFTETGGSQWWFDGTNLYENIIALGGPRPLGSPRANVASNVKSNASVHVRASSDGHPLGSLEVNLPWLAFCSGTYLKRAGRLIPFPLTDIRHSPDCLAYSDKTETFEDDWGVPRSVRLYASDTLFDASVKSGVFRGKQDPEFWRRGSTGFKWDFPNGALRFHYVVTESTNFQGRNIPLKFEWSFNVPADGKLATRQGGSAKVTSIRASDKPRGVIVPGAPNQNIVDWRFRDPASGADAIIYAASSLHVAPTNDPALQEKFKARVERALSRPPAGAVRR